MRRKQNVLLPLEARILQAAVDRNRAGEPEFYGFLIASDIKQGEGARHLTAYGTLYKALARLEAWGLLTSRWEDPEMAALEQRPLRRLYTVTGAGQAAAEALPRSVKPWSRTVSQRVEPGRVSP